MLFEKSGGPPQASYHGLTKADHQARLDDLTAPANGYVPTAISVASAGDERWYTGVYEKKSVAGSWELRSTLTPAEYQQKWHENEAAKRGLVWLHTYVHQGQINFVGLWYGGQAPLGRHHLNTAQFESELKDARRSNLYLRGVAGYVRGGQPNFAAFWNNRGVSRSSNP